MEGKRERVGRGLGQRVNRDLLSEKHSMDARTLAQVVKVGREPIADIDRGPGKRAEAEPLGQPRVWEQVRPAGGEFARHAGEGQRGKLGGGPAQRARHVKEVARAPSGTEQGSAHRNRADEDDVGCK